MERGVDDLEFWLPSEFLTDDDLLTDPLKTTACDDFSYGLGYSFGFSSDLSSPVESVTGTTETESDEDDFITELSRRVAQTTLQDSGFSSGYTAKNSKLSGSPQSTLCGFKSGSASNASRVYSPPAAKDAPSWDMLYAAAAEVAKMRMIEETTAFHSSKLFAPPPKHNPASVNQQKVNPAMRFPPNQTQAQAQFSYLQLQAAKFQQMKQHQIMKNGAWEQQGMIEYQLQNARRNNGAGRAEAPSMAAWPTLQQSQQKTGSGMRAVFLTENGMKKERIGTGVFMPRRFNTNTSNSPTETRRKPASAAGCSTVLIPERVVHALNLNLDSIDAKVQNRGHGNLRNQYANNSMNEELRLPQEWTY